MFQQVALCSVIFALSSAVPPPHMQGRIVGGSPADISNFPYQVGLQLNGVVDCGGSIVDRNYVVTAAHCVEGRKAENLSFRAGSSLKDSGGSVHPAAEVFIHPSYSNLTIDCDIAVVKVLVPFEYNDNVQPIEIASEEPAAGAPAVVSGWGLLSSDGGAPTQLQQVQVNIIDREECRSKFPSFVTSNMLCAGTDEGGKGPCSMDSGGPLAVNGKLVGVVSWTTSACGAKGFPSGYADVLVLKNFISSSMQA